MILVGAQRPGMAHLSATLGAVVFLAFAFGRMVSFVLDGWPGEGILAAFAIELVVGLLCLVVSRTQGQMPSWFASDRKVTGTDC